MKRRHVMPAVWTVVVLGWLVAPGVCAAQEPAATPPASAPDAEADPNAPPEVTPEEEAQQAELPKLEEMELPSMESLLRDPPVDWVVLYSQKVLVVQPVTPRPNTLAQMEAALQASYLWPRGQSREEIARISRDRQRLLYLRLVLAGAEDDTEYQLHRRLIEQVLCYEDLVLRRVDQQLDDRELDKALELLLFLDRRHRGWPGYDERQQRLLLLEAERHLAEGANEPALVYLQELHGLNPDYAGLSQRLGQAAGRLIRDAVAEEDHRAARHFLRRLEALNPRHAVATQWTNRLAAEAASLMDEAQQAFAARDPARAADRIDRASIVWPAAPGLREAHRRLSTRHPIVKVGVLEHGVPEARPTDSWIDASRLAGLTRVPLFETRSIERGIPRYRSRFFEQWEPNDLGREMQFALRRGRATWQSSSVPTAGSLLTDLAARIETTSPRYDERFAGYVQRLSARSPHDFSLQFGRVPLRSEALLDLVASTAVGRNEPFRLEEERGNTRIYRRAYPEPDDVLERHVAEIREVAYGDPERAFQGLLRGDVSVLTGVYGRYVAPLRDDGRFFLQQHALPTTHLLQFHPQSPLARSRQLRRALHYGLDRPALLSSVVLRQADAGLGRLATGPFASNSYGHHPLLRPTEYNLSLAVALSLGAKKELGEQYRPLRLACVPNPVAEEAAAKLLEHWKRAGMEVTLLSRAEVAAGAEWDILYRTVQIVEPLYELWPLLALRPDARIDDLTHLPDWLRQGLLELEYATDWSAALDRLRELQRELLAEAQIIPLWELDEYLVVRKTIGGVPLRPVHPYSDVERWTVQPWFSTDSP